MQELITNPKDSIIKVEALLVNKNTRLNDIDKNIQSHEQFLRNHDSSLSGDVEFHSNQFDNNEMPLSNSTSDNKSSIVAPILLSLGLLIGAYVVLFDGNDK